MLSILLSNRKPNASRIRQIDCARALILNVHLLWLGLLVSSCTKQAWAACLTCPQNATEVAIGSTLAVHAAHGDIDRAVAEGGLVGACETVRLHATVQYAPVGTSGAVGSGFTGGTGAIFIIARGMQTGIKEYLGDVTPPNMETTLVTPTNPLVNPNLCIPPAGTIAVEAKAMLTNVYTLTAADIAAGLMRFRFEYTGTALLQDPVTGQCLDLTYQAQEKTVRIAPMPICTIIPPAILFPGSCEDITVTVIGQGPITVNLTGPGINATANNVGAPLFATNTVTFTNIACAPASGATNTYTATVADFANCQTNCTTTLAGAPAARFASIAISGSDLVLSGSGGTTNGAYTVVTTTNAGIPLTLWSPVATNNFDANGLFLFSNHINLNESKRYFRLMLP